MKTLLTVQQTEELNKRGITINENNLPVYDIGELFSLLKSSKYILCIERFKDLWEVGFKIEKRNISPLLKVIHNKELIDALYELLLWCLDNHIKLN